MTSPELLREVYIKMNNAQRVLNQMWKIGQAKPSDVSELLHLLRQATAAAQSLESLARGNPEPKVGS